MVCVTQSLRRSIQLQLRLYVSTVDRIIGYSLGTNNDQYQYWMDLSVVNVYTKRCHTYSSSAANGLCVINSIKCQFTLGIEPLACHTAQIVCT